MTLRASATTLVLVAACAAPRASVAPPPGRAWPPPPLPARVRWVGAFPGDGEPARRARPWWRAALEAVVGLGSGQERPAEILARPFGLAAMPDGFVVADPDLRKVLRVTWPGARTAEVRCRGAEWRMPMAVAAAPDGSLLVADGGAGRVLVVPVAGACRSLGDGLLQRPTGVAWHAGVVYVVDPPRHAIDAFDARGAHLATFGARGDARGGGVNFPTGIAVRPDGTLYVVDSLNFRVSRFGPGGEYRGSFGGAGDGSGAFGRPKAVSIDGAGRAFVTDAQHDVVVVFSPEDEFELAIGGSGVEAGRLTLPTGVAVAGRTLYVANSYRRRVEVYELLGGTP